MLWAKSKATIVAALAVLMLAGCSAVNMASGDSGERGLSPLAPLGEVPIPKDNPMSEAKVELGRMLFFDRRLSGDGTMSCASCHMPEMAFTDSLPISLNYPTTRNWRNSPTLINIGYARTLFHDGRAVSLEEQALFPMMSAFEMNQNLDFMEEEIREVPQYVAAFKDAFGAGVTRYRIAQAIAAYERTIVSKNVPLDRYLAGDVSALSADAKAGMELFLGKAGCIRCHGGAYMSDGGYHANGVPENEMVTDDPRTAITVRFVAKVSGYEDYENLTEDPGRYLVTKRPRDWKAFRTPTLREVARTSPYMHNGVFATLEEVIEFYDGGAGEGNSERLAPLGLSADEKRSLMLFLTEALSGNEIEVKYPKIP